jgi:hypothetical protein
MTEHFTSEDVAAWEGTVQGNPEGDDPAASVEPVPGVSEEVAAQTAEWAGTVQGDPEGASEADGDS